MKHYSGLLLIALLLLVLTTGCGGNETIGAASIPAQTAQTGGSTPGTGSADAGGGTNSGGTGSGTTPTAPTTPANGPSTPANATRFTQIQKMSGWQSCTVCAGPGGNGPVTTYSMTQNILTPSLSGAAAKFSVADVPWGAGLWWKQIGGNDAAHNFVYELDFYLENPSAAQALEFDMNQNAGGKRYIYGTECNLKGDGTWRVWDYQKHWMSTGVKCQPPVAGKWNHLAWEFKRTDSGTITFVAVTLNGVRTVINKTANAYAEGGSGIDTAIQIDLDGTPHDYSMWVDNITVSYWP